MSTIIGIFFGVSLLIGSVLLMGGGFQIFLDPAALMIVLGGTLAATLISFPLTLVLGIFKISIRLFRNNHEVSLERSLERVLQLALKASQTSIYALEREADTENNPYIKAGLQLLVKDSPIQRISRFYTMEIEGVRVRHQQGVRLFTVMSKVAPSFGLVGTLLGLINMLRGITAEISPETLGPSMAVAMVTTLYGALLAFLLFLPASEKLRSSSTEEITQINLIRDGILMIKEGYPPREMEQLLQTHISRGKRSSYIDKLTMQGGG